MFRLTQKKKDGDSGTEQKRGVSAAELRISKDLNEIAPSDMYTIEFPNPDDLLNFKVVVCPDEGFYKDGRFVFSVAVGPEYPHKPPKVKCDNVVFHPNIDARGNVCLNILREDWKPVLNINAVMFGLGLLFTDPNADDPLNKEAADMMKSNVRMFEMAVRKSMEGGSVGSSKFDRCLK